MKQSGIYCWYLNGVPKYIGKSVDVNNRMARNHRDNPILSLAINKYGYDTFEKTVVCYCSESELDELEEYYIKEFKTHRSTGGYNLTWGGEGAGSGKNHPLYGVTGEDHPSYGTKRSSETIKRMSDAHKGIKHTEEARQKLSNAMSGKSNPFFGRKYDHATSQYHGVSKVNRRYRALITINGKSKHLGYFDTEIEAAQAYNDYVIEKGLPQQLNEF